MSQTPQADHLKSTATLPKVVRAKGSYLWDAAGKQYIDGSGGPAVYCLGHANAEVNAAVAASKMERSLSTDAAAAAMSMFLLHDGEEG